MGFQPMMATIELQNILESGDVLAILRNSHGLEARVTNKRSENDAIYIATKATLLL